MIQAMTPKRRGKYTYLWITLAPETARFTCSTISFIQKLFREVINLCVTFLKQAQSDLFEFSVTKLDLAKDYKRSFLPPADGKVTEKIRKLIEVVVNDLLNEGESKFFTPQTESYPLLF